MRSAHLAWSKLQMGEDLPLGVYRDWKRWCKFPRYFFDDPGMPHVAGLFGRVRTPIIAANATDDLWAPPASRDAFMAGYSNTTVRKVDIHPGQLGIGPIGHMGYFRPRAVALWQQALDEDRAEREARVTRTIIVRDGARDVIGQAPARAVSIPGEGWEFEVVMNDGQKLFVLLPRPNRPENNPGRRAPAWLQTPTGFAWLLGFVALAVALGAYPIVRRLTKRLETLQKGVERWGAGDLSARMPVTGEDEVAFLAERFNASAERVQTLLQAHKALLANASHELRSPLARIRMGLELLGRDPGTASARAEIARNIAELDQLVDEMLDYARLEAQTVRLTFEEVDLVELLENLLEKLAPLPGAPILLQRPARLRWTCDGHYLEPALQNLLLNAKRYARSQVMLTVQLHGNRLQLVVEERLFVQGNKTVIL